MVATTREDAAKFMNRLKAKKKLTVTMYDADRAFANPSNPRFNKEAASDAHERTIEFLKKNLLE